MSKKEFTRLVDDLDEIQIKVNPKIVPEQLQYVEDTLWKGVPLLTIGQIWSDELKAPHGSDRSREILGKATRLAIGAYRLMNEEPVVTIATANYIFCTPPRTGDALDPHQHLARAISILALNISGQEEVLANRYPIDTSGESHYLQVTEHFIEMMPYCRVIMAEIIRSFIQVSPDAQIEWESKKMSKLREMVTLLS